MKKYISAVMVAVLLLNTSCDDWLTPSSDMDIKVDEQFEHLNGFKEALNGAYAGLARTSLYAKNLSWYLVDICAQQYESHEYDYYDFYFPEQKLFGYHYNDLKVEGALDATWADAYSVIANVNLLLENLEMKKGEINEVAYNIIKGEALAIRAMLHFDLIRLFGHGNWATRTDLDTRMAIPYVNQYTPQLTKQKSYTETFMLLQKDINESVELLKSSPVYAEWTDEYVRNLELSGEIPSTGGKYTVKYVSFLLNTPNRFDYYGARALQARIYLWEGSAQSKSTALEAARECITFFKTGVKRTSANGLALRRTTYWTPLSMLNSTNYELNDYVGIYEGLMSLSVTDFNAVGGSYFRAGDQYMNEEKTLYMNSYLMQELYQTEQFGDRDMRYAYMFVKKGWADEYMIPMKRFTTAGKSTNVIHLLKIAEMYYIAAECLATGPGQDLGGAIDYLDEVRLKRGLDTSLKEIMTQMTPEAVMNEVKREYQKEFVCEGQLFFYYKRHGLAEIDNYYEQMNEAKYLWPYPDDEITFGNRVQ